jgi:hypothetical protein
MNESSAQWQEVASRAEALALKLKMHVEQAGDDHQAEAALDQLRAVLHEAFEAAGTAFRDDAVRDDIRDVGRLLGEALHPTVTRVGGEVRDLFERH